MSDGEIVVKLTMEDGGYKVAVVNAGRLMREFKQSLDSTATSIKKVEEHQFSLGRKFRDLVMTMGALRFVAMDVNDIFLRLPMSILKTAGELEKMQQLMTGLSKETDLAARKLEGMKDMNFVVGVAKSAPFDIQALSDSFVKLKVAGIDPADGSMQALVDSVARFGGSGEMLKRASVAIQQMSGKGVISMEELRQQLGEAVPTAMKAMAEGMEMSMAELAKVVSTGTLKAGPALQKMFLRMQIDNAGAAAEMMETWVGMNARLKTEWDLTAKAIADAGFLDESKRTLAELIELLRSPEFQEFGTSLGRGLGEAVRMLSDFAGLVMRNREEVILLVQAWLAYKVITSGIRPISKTLEDGFKSKAASMRTLVADISQLGQAERVQAVESARNAADESARASALLASRISNDNKELASVRAKKAAILAESTALSGQLAALQRAERQNNANNIGEQQRKIYQIEQLSGSLRQLTSRELELRRGIADTTRAFQVSTVATAEKINAANNLARAMNGVSFSTAAATYATEAFGAVSSFLGGPVGIAITVITGLVMWWNNVRDAAKEAKEAQLRAASGATVAADVEILTDKAKEASKELEEARKRLAETDIVDARNTGQSRKTVTRKKNEDELEADRAAYASALAKDKAAYEALQRARTNILEQNAERNANNRMLDLDRELRDMDFATRQKIAKIKTEKDAYIKANGDTSKVAVAEIARFNREQSKILEAGLNERLTRAKKVAADARAAASASNLNKDEALQRNLEVKKAEERVEELETRLKGVQEAINVKPVLGPEKDKKTKESPFQKLIENLAADRKRLEAEIEGLKGVPGQVDKVAGAIAEVQQEIKDGKYGKLSPGQAKQVIDSTEAKAKLEKEKEDLEKAAKDYQRVADFIEGQKPEIESALEFLADPLGSSKKGVLERRALKFIGSNLTEIEAYAKKMNLTVDQVKNQITGDFQRADAANAFAKIKQETKELNDSMVDDSRDAARARTQAENERHQVVLQNIIDERAKFGASAEEIERLQDALSKNMEARASKLKKDFEGPIEKLASNWKNVTKNMEEASVGWANSTMGAITQMVMTGKADFKSLANSIIADIIRINLQKAASSALSSIGGMIMGALTPGSTPSASTSTYSLTTAPNYSGGGLGFKFADGGIMTEFGSLPLRKYANGGIARSPQLAMFGEGSMPEAYVPLPDGRSIPVTMKGGAGDSVTINITINKDGGESESAEGNDPQMYRRLGERIKGVVREELAAQKRPGGLLYT